MESLGKQQLYRHPRKNHTSTSIHAAGVGGPGCDQRLPVHTQPQETALHDGTDWGEGKGLVMRALNALSTCMHIFWMYSKTPHTRYHNHCSTIVVIRSYSSTHVSLYSSRHNILVWHIYKTVYRLSIPSSTMLWRSWSRVARQRYQQSTSALPWTDSVLLTRPPDSLDSRNSLRY